MTKKQITIPKETAQRLFDALVGSMDFGSGMLDTDDVEALRDLAGLLGVDPSKATPQGFMRCYPHPYKPMTGPAQIDQALGVRRVVAVQSDDGWTTERNDEPVPYVPCAVGWPWCAKPDSDPIHAVGTTE